MKRAKTEPAGGGSVDVDKNAFLPSEIFFVLQFGYTEM